MDTPGSTSPLRTGIAEEIRALLGRRAISKIDLSRRIGKSHTYVWRRLTGETAFDTDDLERIAQVLGVPVVDLFPASYRATSAGSTGRYPTRDPLAARVVATVGQTQTSSPTHAVRTRPAPQRTPLRPPNRAAKPAVRPRTRVAG